MTKKREQPDYTAEKLWCPICEVPCMETTCPTCGEREKLEICPKCGWVPNEKLRGQEHGPGIPTRGQVLEVVRYWNRYASKPWLDSDGKYEEAMTDYLIDTLLLHALPPAVRKSILRRRAYSI